MPLWVPAFAGMSRGKESAIHLALAHRLGASRRATPRCAGAEVPGEVVFHVKRAPRRGGRLPLNDRLPIQAAAVP